MVVKSTRGNMSQGKAQALQFLEQTSLFSDDQKKDALKAKLKPGVEAGVIAGVKVKLVDDQGKELGIVNAMSRDEVNAVLQQGGSSIDDKVDNSIDAVVTKQLNQMTQISQMTDAQIEQMAQSAGPKIAPLVTVKREYIQAMFDAIDAQYTTGSDSDKVIAYLTDTTNGLGLTDGTGGTVDQITALKAKYLNQ
jgi:hypothetical protein